MNVIISTEYNSFHADMSPSEFESLLKIMTRAKRIERTYVLGDKPVYVLGDNNAPTMPEVEPKAE